MEKDYTKCPRRNPQKDSGYTFIEVLVGITIVTLIFSFGYVGFREFARRQVITSAVRELKGELRLAQEQAFAGKKPNDPSCNSPNTLQGYYFRVTSPTTYAIEAYCTGGTVELKQEEISSTLELSTPTPNPILFRVLGEGTNITSVNAVLTITLTASGDSQNITISQTGEIQ